MSTFTDNKGNEFCCNEQYMMYHKAILFNDEESARKIMDLRNPYGMKVLGRGVKGFIKKKWNENCMRIVTDGCFFKFSQNKKLGQYLLNTGNKKLAEAAPNDSIWGIGMSRETAILNGGIWKGQNKLGLCLMLARSRMRTLLKNDGEYTLPHNVFKLSFPNKIDAAREKKMLYWFKLNCSGIMAKLASNKLISTDHLQSSDWQQLQSWETWRPILKAKFDQNPEAKEVLINSGNKLLYEVERMCRTQEKLWGCQIYDDTGCKDWKLSTSKGFCMNTYAASKRENKNPKMFGQNVMGKHLMRLRKEYMPMLPSVPETISSQEEYIKKHDGFPFNSGSKGKARMLSNLYDAAMEIEDDDGDIYMFQSSEHAYQSLKDKPENRFKWSLSKKRKCDTSESGAKKNRRVY